MIRLVPPALVFGVLCLLSVSRFSRRVDRSITRFAFRRFGGRKIDYELRRERLLRSAAMGVPYREYASKTYLYAVLAGCCGVIVAFYFGAGLFALAEASGVWIDPVSFFGPAPALGTVQFAVLAIVSVVLGASFGAGTYALRWWLPASRAKARRRRIEASLPRMVAFMYALTRGGMSVPDVFRTLAKNEAVFGEGAAEIETVVRNMDLFNVDLITAVEDLSVQTPSEQLSTFAENFGSVLQSGGNVSEFLNEQYERYREEAEEQQAEILNLLATAAEVYVTVVVAGLLFLVTILLIIGLTVSDTLFVMQVITYGGLPVINVLFLLYLLDITKPLRVDGDRQRRSDAGVFEAGGYRAVSDGGYIRPGSEANHERLCAYRRLRSIRETLASPVAALVERPVRLLYVTVPIAAIVTAYRFPAVLLGGGIDVRVLDGLLVEAAVLLMGSFAIVYEYKKRRLGRLEAELPDLLDRLASLNEAGIAVVSSFGRVRKTEIGALDPEIERIWRDMNWGATAAQALSRFEERVRTPSVTRIVTLITNAMRASNEIGPVLRIAARQARSELRLRRERKQEMFTYLVVVYISFLVFLVVIGALEQVLIPNLPDTGEIGGGVGAGVPGLSRTHVDREAYRLVFFHAALIQSVASGIVAGVMGNGSIKDGMKHATAMLLVTYLALAVLA